MKDECNLTAKRISRHPVARNSEAQLEKRAIWSRRGEPAIVETPSTKAISRTILGAISSVGVINVSMRKPGNVKKRKVHGATKRKASRDRLSVPKGTTGAHCMHFIIDTLDIMDNFPAMKGFHIIMDNVPIHVPEVVDPLIIKRGYVPIYLPPYSLELNPIEQFWSVVKSKVRRHTLEDTETLITKIVEACEAVPLEHLQNIIGHLFKLFKKCSNKQSI
ncbi:hypothetical protein G6F55_006995 [Rhizopus delemar]|nr:hypothetical protein G6F55_006995 [Rhizopus delemar]KAG1545323.1 hypothetical protein G6F51_005536 [Rhizopus arrhizus]KAG1496412.1 hypothetical protein G6F53_012178 [Rhizopus delemar]KAG1505560.1 hypothetical protein G6F54_000215 [Rhizopus delemar]KAG1520420.1 hypothetical protein G6F52_007680 [Rhizopus delemar]